MKVVAINGSPRKNGNTQQAIDLIAKELETQRIELVSYQIAPQINGCLACYHCLKTGNGHCIQKDNVNEIIDAMVEADGILLASPVYYGGIAGSMKSFLDRAFLAAGTKLHHKVGAAFATLRRTGGLETYQQLNAYLNTMEMYLATSNYWGAIHGLEKGEIHKDEEGLDVLKTLAKNMAWLIQAIELAKTNLPIPQNPPRTMTNFVR